MRLGKYQRSVSIIGAGCAPFKNLRENPETEHLSEQDMFSYAARKAMEDAHVEPRDVQFFYEGEANPAFIHGAITPAMQVADWIGMRGKGSVHHSEACCTGYVALEEAVEAVASGAYDIVLSGGVDMSGGLPEQGKPSCFRRDFTLKDMLPTLEWIYENAYTRGLLAGEAIGFDEWISLYGLEYGLTDEQLDDTLNAMAYNCRRAAALNPLAFFYGQDYDSIAKGAGMPDAKTFLKSPMNPKMSEYLRVSGCEQKCDGAAAIVVCPTEMAKEYVDKPIEVLGIGASCLEASQPFLEKKATAIAAKQAYEQAGVTPDEIDLFLCNDFILSSHLLAAEEVGYLPRGEGWRYAIEGRTAFDGDKPINTNGGRCHFGHAHGASGLADLYEATRQMRGEAGVRQVRRLPQTTFVRGFGGGQNVRGIVLRTVE